MTNEQYYVSRWLARMWDADIEVNQLIARRDEIISMMSGIGKYDDEFIPAQTGENSTETKYLEYSELSAQIDKKLDLISRENNRTLQTINKVDDSMLRGMLVARYVRRLSWQDVGHLYNYEKTITYKKYRLAALDAVMPFIPKGELDYENE